MARVKVQDHAEVEEMDDDDAEGVGQEEFVEQEAPEQDAGEEAQCEEAQPKEGEKEAKPKRALFTSDELEDPWTDDDHESMERESGGDDTELEEARKAFLSTDYTDEEVERHTRALSTLETGTYRWKQAPTVTVDFNDEDKQSHYTMQVRFEKHPDKTVLDRGRAMIRIKGQAVSKLGKGGTFEIAMSPDEKFLESGDRDFFTQNYGQAELFYFQVNSKNCRNPEEMLKLLSSGKYQFYVTKSRNGKNYFKNFSKMS